MSPRSINDWFADHEHQGRDGGLDWENDELPDRSVTSWVDRPTSEKPGADRSRRQTPTRRARRQRPDSQPDRRSPLPNERVPSDQAIATAAQRILRAEPGTPFAAIARQLAQFGHPVSRKDVSRALSSAASKTRESKRSRDRSKRPRQPPAPASVSQLPASWLERNRQQRAIPITLAVRELLAARPGMTDQQVVEKLQGQFPDITQADVTEARKGWRPKKKRSTPKRRKEPKPREKGRPLLEAPGQACPSCGSPISLTGSCRCS